MGASPAAACPSPHAGGGRTAGPVYSGSTLDRCGGQRRDADWVAAALADPGTRLVPLWRDRCLTGADPALPLTPRLGTAGELLAAAGQVVLLGADDGAAVAAVDLSALGEAEALAVAGASAAVDVRGLVGSLPAREAGVQAYARGILHWNRHQRFCGACGSPAEPRDGGHVRRCTGPDCGKLLFPRIEPAVLALVEAPDGSPRVLMGRHKGAPEDSYSTLAGFVEVGESLEDAVRREVAEEAGVVVDEVVYQASQAWPFPAGLMAGFRARATGLDIAVDEDELTDARWVTAQELAARRPSRADGMDRYLIDRWLAEVL